MSAPTTPAEMADWLEEAAGLTESPWVDEGSYCPDGDILREAAKMLRSVPTDAQKIEALKWAAMSGEQRERSNPHHRQHYRLALRLLGLPTE